MFSNGWAEGQLMSEFHVVECAIRQLHARYADAVWRKDVASFGDCFAENCEWRIAGQVLRGRAEAVDFMSGVFPMLRRVLFITGTPILEVGDRVASARTSVTEQSAFTNGQAMLSIGTYFERFVQEEDRWRFSWRVFQQEYVGPPDLSADFYENPSWGPPPALPPSDEIPPDHSGLLS
jgi:hypothetical protein